jgi:hypothetical protein
LPIPPTPDAPEGYFPVALLAPRQKEILIAKAALHSLAQGMAQLPPEAPRIPVAGRERLGQVIGQDVT